MLIETLNNFPCKETQLMYDKQVNGYDLANLQGHKVLMIIPKSQTQSCRFVNEKDRTTRLIKEGLI